MNPVRVTAPASPVVAVADLRAHLRVDQDFDDLVIEAYEAAAVALLDGYRGILGRCILEQEWAVTYDQAGTYRLPLPDVSAVVAVDADSDPVVATLTHDGMGSCVEIEAAATVTMTCALPAESLPVVVMAVKLLVGHWYANREAVAAGSMSEVPLAFDALVSPLRRWAV